MIRYALACEHDHPFEAWFGSSQAYDDQAGRGLVECPFCASRSVRKQIMAPAVRGGAPDPEDGRARSMMMQAAERARSHIAANFDYVGDAFAREARAIHEGDSERRAIYGEATPAEVRALKADGVACASLPAALTPRPREDLN